MSGQASEAEPGAAARDVPAGPAGPADLAHADRAQPGGANVADGLRAAARRYADRPALITAGGVSTWGQLDAAVDAGVGRIREAGGVGTRVLMALPTGSRQAAALLAVLRAGMIAVQVEPTHPDLRWVGERVGAGLAITDRDDHGCAAAIRTDEIRRWWEPSGPHVGNTSVLASPPGAAGEDLALLARSGRAGLPVMLSHRAILAALRRMLLAPGFDLTAEDRLIQALPLYHVVGLVSTFLPAAAVGAAVVIPDLEAVGRTPPEAVLAAVREHRGTVLPAEPTLYRQLCRADEFAASVAGLRLMLCSAYALDPADLTVIRATTGLTVRQGYGVSESAATVTSTLMASPESGDPRSGSVGRAYPDVAVRIVVDDGDDEGSATDGDDPAGGPDARGARTDDGDRLVDLADDGGIGRIAISGPTLFSGYWPDGTGGPGAGGWFVTGDIGFLDDDDELHLVDRMTETVVVSGFTVYPREVESVLCDHPAIADAAVIGVPSNAVSPVSAAGSTASSTPGPPGPPGPPGSSMATSSSVAAVIVPRPGRMPTVEDLDAFLAGRLAPFKRPSAFQVVDVLPRTEVGRLDRDALRAGFAAGDGRLRAVESGAADDADASPAGVDDHTRAAELSELGKWLLGAGDRAGRSDQDTDDDLF